MPGYMNEMIGLVLGLGGIFGVICVVAFMKAIICTIKENNSKRNKRREL